MNLLTRIALVVLGAGGLVVARLRLKNWGALPPELGLVLGLRSALRL